MYFHTFILKSVEEGNISWWPYIISNSKQTRILSLKKDGDTRQ